MVSQTIDLRDWISETKKALGYDPKSDAFDVWGIGLTTESKPNEKTPGS